MNLVFFARIQKEKSGLTNQFVVLLSSIIMAYNEGKKVVIIGDFLIDYAEKLYTPISKVLDIRKINDYIYPKYGIMLIDKYDVNFKILEVTYGLRGVNIVNITNEIIEKCYTNNRLVIDENIDLNSFKGDPCPNKGKKLYLKYYLNELVLEEEHYEWCKCLHENIIFDLNNYDIFLHRFHWINYLNRGIFDDILKNMVYNSYYHILANEFIKGLDKTKNINIIHLRIEHDAVEYWAKMNKMEENIFENYLQNKYINLINTHIGKNDETIILSYSNGNRVIDYLTSNDYNFKFVNKRLWMGRELNALVDFIIAKECSGVFIGNFNVKKLNGSTFSYFILQNLGENIKKVMIDMDRIYDEPSVGYSSI